MSHSQQDGFVYTPRTPPLSHSLSRFVDTANACYQLYLTCYQIYLTCYQLYLTLLDMLSYVHRLRWYEVMRWYKIMAGYAVMS